MHGGDGFHQFPLSSRRHRRDSDAGGPVSGMGLDQSLAGHRRRRGPFMWRPFGHRRFDPILFYCLLSVHTRTHTHTRALGLSWLLSLIFCLILFAVVRSLMLSTGDDLEVRRYDRLTSLSVEDAPLKCYSRVQPGTFWSESRISWVCSGVERL